MRVYRDEDADLALIRGRRVAIIGYGNQGRAQALNLRDSGVELVIALPEDASRRPAAGADGFPVVTVRQAAAQCDLLMLLAPDEAHGSIYEGELAPHLKQGAALGFSHGLSIRFGLITPRPDLDIFLVAPKGPGTALRQLYGEGRGMIALFAVAQNATGGAEALALSYAAAIGSGRAGILPTTFAEECEADLFNEQAVLWGAIPELIQAGFDTLVDAGFAPEIAYFECLTEVKLLADLIAERGIAGMREVISNTAEYGAMVGGPRIVTEETRAEMRRILAEIRGGSLTKGLIEDAQSGYARLGASRAQARRHRIEQVRAEIEALREGK
jgi:ketol-acid reductoisomerase